MTAYHRYHSDVAGWELLKEHGLLWLRGREVREVLWRNADPSARRTTTISPTWPADLWEPCPDGSAPDFGDDPDTFVVRHDGWWEGPLGARHHVPCPCNGSGWVTAPFLISIEQWRLQHMGGTCGDYPSAWFSAAPPEDPHGRVERRSAVLARCTATGPALPVIVEPEDDGRPRPGDGDYIRIYLSGRKFRIGNSAESWAGGYPRSVEVTDEPWAQHLTPGDVLVPVTVDLLDEPVAEVLCPKCGGDNEWYSQPPGSNCVHVFQCQTCNVGGRNFEGRIPLPDLAVGEWDEVTL